MRNLIRIVAMVILAALLPQAQLLAQSSASALKATIENHLDWDYPRYIKITVQDPGVVTLKGTVSSYWDWRNVFAITSRIPGVQEIKNELIVETETVPDNVIKDEILNYLGLVPALEDPNRIELAVDNGLVILRGTVDSAREANIIEDVVSWHRGVKSVANEIRVLPPQEAGSDANLTSILRDLIARNFPFERNTVQVRVANGKAILTGTVKGLWASMQIEKEVQRIQGIANVDNQLKVQSAT